ncbi:MAG: ATP-dependent DNA helicase RecG [Pseudomonadota bacterium]|nr:ATP-dependent DNA helicase RecG [Pseudomonadota bacterium]
MVKLCVNDPCTILKGVGERIAEKLLRLELTTIQDLLFHLPLRYEDRTHVFPISRAPIGQGALIEGQVVSVEVRMGARRSLVVQLVDDSGAIELRFFHFNAMQQRNLQIPGLRLRCFGEVRWVGSKRGMVHPEYQPVLPNKPMTTSDVLSPVYPTTEGLSQSVLRKLIMQALTVLTDDNNLPDFLTAELLRGYQLPSLVEALLLIHTPPASINQSALSDASHPARQRLVLEELLAHQLSLQQIKRMLQQDIAPILNSTSELVTRFYQQLPYGLTNAQLRVVAEITAELQQPRPMLRLVQGDVGSGKTVVAAIALMQVVASGYQAAFMAPTELLAEQHYRNLLAWFTPLGVKVAWLTGSQKTTLRREMLQVIADGSAQIVVGTHALFQPEVCFARLGLAVIDEQHRFGVQQRLSLRNKGIAAGHSPHQLVMTATPIPRTLAMTAYADLDISIIDELPPGRTPVTTVTIPNSRRADVIERVQAVCAAGKQAYWVCTLIEESEVLECQAAEDIATQLRDELQTLKIGLVHGRMKPQEKEEVMSAFKSGKFNLLVATTVIEVGVDVPNASLMIIENPERLGLAQLHQLRGRVGRDKAASFCVLLYQSPLSQHAQGRLATLRETNDGFIIAQKDLELRGPGEVLGTRQTGLLQLKIADLMRDAHLLPQVRELAQAMLQHHPEKIAGLIYRWVKSEAQYIHV